MAEIFKVAVPVGAGFRTVEAIIFDGSLWLAPVWQLSNDEQEMRPLWLVPVMRFGVRRPGPGPHQFVLTKRVPSRLIDGPLSPADVLKFRVLQEPDMVFPNPAASD